MISKKNTIYLLIIPILLLVFSGCSLRPANNDQTDNNSDQNEEQQVATGSEKEDVNSEVVISNGENINSEMATTSEEIDTSDWKTYRNEEYGFEVKYPENWDYVISPGINRIEFVPYSVKEKFGEKNINEGEIFLSASQDSVMYILPGLGKKEEEWIENNNQNREDIIVNNFPAVKYKNITGAQDAGFILSVGDAVHILRGSVLYEILFTKKRYSEERGGLEAVVSNPDIFDAILNSFKFIQI